MNNIDIHNNYTIRLPSSKGRYKKKIKNCKKLEQSKKFKKNFDIINNINRTPKEE